jgi:hypothetical protein
MAEQQEHNGSGTDGVRADGGGEHRQQGHHSSTTSAAANNRSQKYSQIHQVLCQTKCISTTIAICESLIV